MLKIRNRIKLAALLMLISLGVSGFPADTTLAIIQVLCYITIIALIVVKGE